MNNPEKDLLPPAANSNALPMNGVRLMRPFVQKVTCEVLIQRAAAEKMFSALRFLEHETCAVVTEVLRPAKPDEPVALVHGASGQKFVVDHYELDGVRI